MDFDNAAPDVLAASHSHSMYGKSWSTLGRLLDPLTQYACAFYDDHAVFDDYTGVVLDTEEGKKIAHALGGNKAAILPNPGQETADLVNVDLRPGAAGPHVASWKMMPRA